MPDTPATGSWFKPSQARSDLVAALALFALGAGFLAAIVPLDLGQSDAPGPGMFPAIVAVALLIVSIAMMLQHLRRNARPKGDVPLGHAHSLISAVTLLVVTAAFERIGFPLASFVMLLVLTRTFAKSGWVATLLFAGLTTAACYLIFTRVFGVALPAGSLFTG